MNIQMHIKIHKLSHSLFLPFTSNQSSNPVNSEHLKKPASILSSCLQHLSPGFLHNLFPSRPAQRHLVMLMVRRTRTKYSQNPALKIKVEGAHSSNSHKLFSTSYKIYMLAKWSCFQPVSACGQSLSKVQIWSCLSPLHLVWSSSPMIWLNVFHVPPPAYHSHLKSRTFSHCIYSVPCTLSQYMQDLSFLACEVLFNLLESLSPLPHPAVTWITHAHTFSLDLVSLPWRQSLTSPVPLLIGFGSLTLPHFHPQGNT